MKNLGTPDQSFPRLFILDPGSLGEPASMQSGIRFIGGNPRHRGSPKKPARYRNYRTAPRRHPSQAS